jgi:hypothetical protein
VNPYPIYRHDPTVWVIFAGRNWGYLTYCPLPEGQGGANLQLLIALFATLFVSVNDEIQKTANAVFCRIEDFLLAWQYWIPLANHVRAE